MKELKNVILTLFSIQSQIHVITKSLNKLVDQKNHIDEIKFNDFPSDKITFSGALTGVLSNYTIILYCSFLDEYNKNFVSVNFDRKFKDRVFSCRQKNKPGLKRINKWTDMYSFRNEMAAHNFRIKKKSFFSDEFDLLEYHIPNSDSEKNLIDGIIYFIC